jgi:hypothetical protein
MESGFRGAVGGGRGGWGGWMVCTQRSVERGARAEEKSGCVQVNISDREERGACREERVGHTG